MRIVTKVMNSKGFEKEFTVGLKIVFDISQAPVYSNWGDLKSQQKLVDENGQEIEFNSIVNPANYMASKGWNFQQTYTANQNIGHKFYLMGYYDLDLRPCLKTKIMYTKELNKYVVG